MGNLAACYFCGAALDDSLATVSLGDGPDAPTLTLCAGCKEKLETVLGAVEGKSGAVDSADPAGTPDSGTSPSQPDSPSPAAADDSPDVEPPTETATSPPEPPESEAPTDDSPAAADDAGGDDAGTDDTDDDGRSIVEGDQEISALEYNKVMRLLQNREFPVDREEIVTVAANAYQVARADCDRVIDVAIDRGILEEADGQLVKPD